MINKIVEYISVGFIIYVLFFYFLLLFFKNFNIKKIIYDIYIHTLNIIMLSIILYLIEIIIERIVLCIV